MIENYNRLSFVYGIPGLVLQILGNLKAQAADGPTFWSVIALLGTILLFVGFAYYAKAKGRHWAWCFMALLSIIGLIVLACLKDKSNTL